MDSSNPNDITSGSPSFLKQLDQSLQPVRTCIRQSKKAIAATPGSPHLRDRRFPGPWRKRDINRPMRDIRVVAIMVIRVRSLASVFHSILDRGIARFW
jgi:hypothetical protein